MSEIILEFESFDLEQDSNPPGGVFCRYDRLEIWDGFPEVGPHIGRYCGQKTPGRIRSSSGILSMVFYTDSAIAKEGFSANYSVLQSSISEDFKCMEALGMESGEIHSDQITASSQYGTNWSVERSCLNYPENGWTPGEDSLQGVDPGGLGPPAIRYCCGDTGCHFQGNQEEILCQDLQSRHQLQRRGLDHPEGGK